jgi:hypothetical protein
MIDGTFDASRYRWKEVTGRPGSKYKIHHDYTRTRPALLN